MKEWAEQFYKSDTWKKTRLSYLVQQNFICERCGQPAVMVHHKNYLSRDNIEDPELTISFKNLEALCDQCHKLEHMKSEATREGLCFDANGQLIRKQ